MWIDVTRLELPAGTEIEGESKRQEFQVAIIFDVAENYVAEKQRPL